MSYRQMYKVVRNLALKLQTEWGKRPMIVFACLGYEDEHIQFYHPDYLSMPTHVILPDGELRVHPDSPMLNHEDRQIPPHGGH